MASEANETGSRKALLTRVAISMLQTQGYLGLGVRELAQAASIRAPSVYNHFSSKEELTRQAMCMYREHQRDELNSLHGTAATKLSAYLELFADMLRDESKVCLGLALAADRNVLPPEVVDEVRKFADQNAEWIGSVWEAGSSDGTINAKLSGPAAGKILFGALEGLMLFALLDTSPVSAFLSRSKSLLGAMGVE